MKIPTVPRGRFVRAGMHRAIPPNVYIYVRSKLPSVTMPEGVFSFEAYYDSQNLWPPVSLKLYARFSADVLVLGKPLRGDVVGSYVPEVI